MSQRVLLVFMFLATALYSNRPPSLAITESIPSSIVAGAVNVITGDHYFTEEDIVVHGAFPIKIPRTYTSSFGWEQFPQLHASLETKQDGRSDGLYWFLTVVEPSGTRLEFQREAKELKKHDPGPIVFQLNPTSPTSQGLTNTAKGEISGKTNLKNIRLELSKDRKVLTFYAPDGTIRTYWKIDCWKTGDIKDEKDCLFLLQCEQHPNQSKTVYIYDDHRRLAIVRTMNLDATKTFASATIPNRPKKEVNYDIHTSDGRALSFRYNYQKEDGVPNSLLSRVFTPTYPEEVLSYHKIKKWGFVLNRRMFPDNRYYGTDYYVEGKNHVGGHEFRIKTTNPLWRRIKTLNAPVGVDTTSIVTHTFTYDVNARVTNVRDIDNILTQYRYSPNYRLEHILYYGPADRLHHSERYVWGEEGPLTANLLCHTFLDHQNNPIFSKRFFYDNQGNVQEEKLYGNLSGQCSVPIVLGSDGLPQNNGVETYTIKRSYSQDRFNLLLREEEQNGKVTLYQYYPNSAVLLAQFICDHDQIKIRHFYEYNSDFILIREITDDGTTTDKNSLYGVKTRLIKEFSLIPEGYPYQGMPYFITEKYWNGRSEVQLKKTVLTYTFAGCIAKQDIYDADDNYCYSLTAKYDAAGRVKEETNAIGQTAVHNYDGVGNKILLKEFSGKKQNKMDYDFSDRLRRIEERGSDGIVYATHHGYNMKHQRIATQDIYGNETQFVPNAFGQVEQINYPSINSPSGSYLYPTEKNSYDSAGRLIQSIDGRGHTTQHRFNARNQITSIEDPDQSAEAFTYHLDGTLASHTNQENATTTYTYDFLGRMVSQTNALGHTTTYTYDAFNLLSVEDSESNVTTYTYDGAGRKIEEELAGKKIEYAYDTLGRLCCTKKGDACHITEYDFLDRLIEEREEDAQQTLYKKTCYAYDEAGNIACITRYIDGKDAQETFTYDSFDRCIEHRDALGHLTTTSYNDHYKNGQGKTVLRTTETDVLGLQTITTYDVLGQVDSVEKKSKTQTLDLEERFYDGNGNLTFHLKNKSHLTEWKFDSINRPETLMEGKSRTTHYAYTKTGALQSKTKPDGVTIFNRYDPLDQLQEVVSSDRSVHYTFDYNTIGQQVLEKDETHGTTTRRIFDPHGKLIQEKLGSDLTLCSEYDEQGRRERLVLPDKTDITFQYDPVYLRNITRKKQNHAFTSYDYSGRLIEQTFIGSLGTMTYSYDLNGRKEGQTSPFNTQIATFDPVGNLSELKTSYGTKTYAYDNLYQLTQERGYEYNYDLYGNRTHKNQEELRYNELNEAISHQQHDRNGNPKTNNYASYTYDALDRLIAVNTSNHQISFRYDYQGRILSKTSNQNTIFFLYDGLKEIGSVDAMGNVLDLRILNPTHPSERGAAILLEINNQSYIPLHDLFGNAIGIFDLQGQPIETYDYSSFGEGVTSGMNAWLYASKRLHSEIGLIFFGKRFYDPKYGRWLTPDPAGFVDGYNLYSFVANNPLTNFDDYGLFINNPILSFPPVAADVEEAKQIAAPVIHAVGDLAIEAGRFCADTGFILSSPWTLYQNNFQWSKVEDRWDATQRTLDSFHHQWDQTMQRSIPTRERDSSYNLIRTTISAAGEAYILAQAAGPFLLEKGSAFLNTRSVANVFQGDLKSTASINIKNARASSSHQSSLLKNHLRQLEDYGAGGYKRLSNGKIRYYGELDLARTPGEMAGRRVVREWNPHSGLKRTWHETLDHNKKIRIVRPELNDIDKIHYVFDSEGRFIGTR